MQVRVTGGGLQSTPVPQVPPPDTPVDSLPAPRQCRVAALSRVLWTQLLPCRSTSQVVVGGVRDMALQGTCLAR